MNDSTKITLNQRTLEKHFKDSYDPVLHAPFQVGDTVMRCGVCDSIIRAELLSGEMCPADTRHIFVAAPVITRGEESLRFRHRIRQNRSTQSGAAAAAPVTSRAAARTMTRWLRLFFAIVLVLSLFGIATGISRCGGEYHFNDLFNSVFARMRPGIYHLAGRISGQDNHYEALLTYFETSQEKLFSKLAASWEEITSRPFGDLFRFEGF